MALAKAAALGMATSPLLEQAKTLAAQLSEVRSALSSAIIAVQVEPLEAALALATTIGLTHYEQPAAQHLLGEVRRLLAEADDLAESVLPESMPRLLREADGLQLKAPSVEQIRKYLEIPADRFLQEQLRAATRRKEEERQDDLKMAIKDSFFASHEGMFDLENFPKLRSPDEFAASKLALKSKRDERREAFLRHQPKPIHTSLCQLDKPYREEAVQMFKCILGYMSDSIASYPLTLVGEMLQKALVHGAQLQTEVYLQLMKQLTDNANPKSELLGWKLFACWLQCFPPDAMVEHYVEWFIKQRASPSAQPYRRLLYSTIRRGPLQAMATDGQINLMLSVDCKKERPVAPELKTYYSAEL